MVEAYIYQHGTMAKLTRKKDRVAQVGSHLTALGDGTGNNGSSSGGESKLEEPESVVVIEVTEAELGITDEGNSGLVTAIRNSPTNGVEPDGSTTGIEQVLEHDVLHILLTDTASTKHGKAGLHHEHNSSLCVGTSREGRRTCSIRKISPRNDVTSCRITKLQQAFGFWSKFRRGKRNFG